MTSEEQRDMKEYAAQATALLNWFQSQDIDEGRAMSVMAYLMGTLVVAASESPSDMISRLQMTNKAIVGTALSKVALRASREGR